MDRRACVECGCDITKRHRLARRCLPCGYAWGNKNGANAAAAAVARAVKRGQLPRANSCKCADCGKPARDYDHRDYNKPLEVQPVCRSCNKLRGPAIPLKAVHEFTRRKVSLADMLPDSTAPEANRT